METTPAEGVGQLSGKRENRGKWTTSAVLPGCLARGGRGNKRGGGKGEARAEGAVPSLAVLLQFPFSAEQGWPSRDESVTKT